MIFYFLCHLWPLTKISNLLVLWMFSVFMIIESFPRLHGHEAYFTLVGEHVWKMQTFHMVSDISSIETWFTTNLTHPLHIRIQIRIFCHINQQSLRVTP